MSPICRQPPALGQTALSERPDEMGAEPLIPPGKPGGGKRRVAIREVINGVMYILSIEGFAAQKHRA